ncbi:hypothetical protein FB567DRAFT_628429 [Paraphoma chrysanthemicola]|uniref:Uncharacterized protein n=1 Tax=Paraphoma chrysanthemicola TaxID=798071 RepID=A0A8K0R6B5_9PLEO|nr:hypothetical protein FB567DRAFT_628429 [Paraphoma chrysanthemicola]
MSTPQPQTPTGDGPASPENRSLINLRRDLDDEADLLKYIPYQRATFQRQDELPGAFPDRLLYGDMMEEKDQLWIYFTLLGGGQTYNKQTGSNRMLSFFTLHAAKNGGAPLRPSRVQDAAIASAPFKMARDGFQIISIAKYFFIKRGVDDKLKVPLSSNTFREDLLRACKAYKAAFDRQELTRQLVPKHPTAKIDGHSAASSRDVSRAPSHTSPEPQAAPAQHRETPAVARDPTTIRSPSHASRYSSTPPSVGQRSPPLVRLSSQDRTTMVKKYITFQAEEEELDRQIDEAENERSEIAAQLVGIKSRLDEVNEKKSTLLVEKERVKAKKKGIQSLLNADEMLEFGFEAGRTMEAKRQKRA